MYQEHYNYMWYKYKQKEITEEEWIDFCLKVSEELMIENRDVLERLKNC